MWYESRIRVRTLTFHVIRPNVRLAHDVEAEGQRTSWTSSEALRMYYGVNKEVPLQIRLLLLSPHSTLDARPACAFFFCLTKSQCLDLQPAVNENENHGGRMNLVRRRVFSQISAQSINSESSISTPDHFSLRFASTATRVL